MAWEPDAAIHLTNSCACANHVVSIAGFSSLLFIPCAVSQIANGDYLAALFFMAIPAVGVGVGRWIRLSTPNDFAILHRDRIELCGVGVFPWSQVQAVHWGRRLADEWDAAIEIEVASGGEKVENSVRLDLAMVLPRDCVKLIRYMRVAGAEVRQDGWPEFCSRYAMPLLEKCHQGQSSSRTGDAAPARSLWLELKCFLVGMLLLPLAFVALIPRCLVADWRLVCWLSAIVIGFAGLRQVIACGWIPAELGKWAMMGLVILVSVPFFLMRPKPGESEAACITVLQVNAVRRWAVYESTGRFPDGVLDDGGDR